MGLTIPSQNPFGALLYCQGLVPPHSIGWVIKISDSWPESRAGRPRHTICYRRLLSESKKNIRR